MLKKIYSLETVLNNSEQQSINGGDPNTYYPLCECDSDNNPIRTGNCEPICDQQIEDLPFLTE